MSEWDGAFGRLWQKTSDAKGDRKIIDQAYREFNDWELKYIEKQKSLCHFCHNKYPKEEK